MLTVTVGSSVMLKKKKTKTHIPTHIYRGPGGSMS
jgi:hypothetical protein